MQVAGVLYTPLLRVSLVQGPDQLLTSTLPLGS